jgi:hypothetical protein
MPDYRCYLITLTGSIWAAHDITCADDEAAIAKAKELYQPHKVEVWRGERRIYASGSPMRSMMCASAEYSRRSMYQAGWRQRRSRR